MTEFADDIMTAVPDGDEVVFLPPGEGGTDDQLDPDAPYGRFANGKPRKSPPGGSAKKKAPRPPKAAAAPRPRSTSRPAPRRTPAAEDFRPAIAEGLNMFSIVLVGLGRKNRAFLADAAAIQLNAESGAHALNEVAKISPSLRELLARSAPAMPWVLLGQWVFTTGMQIAANHGVKIPGTIPGVELYEPESLAQGIEEQMRTAAAQMQQQQADADARAAA